MSNRLSTPLIAAGFAVCLSACVTEPAPGVDWRAVSQGVARQTSFSAACPTPTGRARLVKIKTELEATIAANAPPDTLASEWERLDAGARACRRGR